MNDHGVLAFSNNDDQTTFLHKGVYLGLLIPYTRSNNDDQTTPTDKRMAGYTVRLCTCCFEKVQPEFELTTSGIWASFNIPSTQGLLGTAPVFRQTTFVCQLQVKV